MISHREKRAALGLTQVDLDTAARRTAVALTRESTGLYSEAIRDMLSEAFACAVFAAELPEPEEWHAEAVLNDAFDQGEAAGENALERAEGAS